MRFTIIAASFLFFAPSAALGCSCTPVGLTERLDRAAVVYWSKVESIKEAKANGRSKYYVTVVVEEVIKGRPKQRYILSVVPKESSCHVTVEVGARLRIFMDRREADGADIPQLSVCSVRGNSR